jgi:hypothetical protein
MIKNHSEEKVYICPMHPSVRETEAGKCPQCSMALLPEGTRFGMLRHMIQRPFLLTVMVVVMVAAMVALMQG